MHGHVAERGELLVKRLPGRPSQVLVVLQVAVDYVCGECLDSIVDFVAVEVAAGVLHEVVGPVGEHVASVGMLVVLDKSQAFF